MNTEYLKDKPVAVLGGGATARGHAACTALAGREVRLYELPEFFEGLGCIASKREIRVSGRQESLYGFKREGLAKIDVVTDDMAKAVRGAGIIVVSFPAVGYAAFLERLIPHLEDGMVVHFTTANFGSLLFRKMLREAGCTKKIVVGEWSSQPYGIRIKNMGGQQMPEVSVNYWAITLRGAALPMTDQDAFFESKRYLPSLDSVEHPVHGDTVADVGFSNVNPILHCPGSILGVGAMENWGVVYGENKYDFSIYSMPTVRPFHGCSLPCTGGMRHCRSHGCGDPGFPGEGLFSWSNILNIHGSSSPSTAVHSCAGYRALYDPQQVYYGGYSVGCHIFSELAKVRSGCAVIESMITLASVMTGTDFRKRASP